VVGTNRPVWVVVVAVYLAFAIATVVVLVRHNTAGASTAPRPGAAPVVVMENLAYKPTLVTVAKGTRVIFRNKDVAPHTVTETSGHGIDSGTINPGKSFSLIVDQSLDYFCTIHPFMKAKVALSG
jgi:plastocyanin